MEIYICGVLSTLSANVRIRETHIIQPVLCD